MDTRTGEILKFGNDKKLRKAIKENPNLKAIGRCDPLCKYLYQVAGKTFCRANRKERRKRKCFKVMD